MPTNIMHKIKPGIPWILLILLSICIWMQIKMNYDKDVRINQLETCIDNLIEQQYSTTNSTEKAVIKSFIMK